MAEYLPMDDSGDEAPRGGLSRDYGDLDESQYVGQDRWQAARDRWDAPPGQAGQQPPPRPRPPPPQQQQPVADKAKEIGASLQAGASRWLKNTKQWLAEKSKSTGAEEARFQDERLQAAREAEVRGSTGPQTEVPLVLGELQRVDLGDESWARGVYRKMVVSVPPGAADGEEFVVALPTGEARLVMPPLRHVAGARLTILYKGYVPDDFGVEFRDEEAEAAAENSNLPVRPNPEERLLEFYRKYNPTEREALLQSDRQGFRLACYDGRYGVHVRHAAFVGVQTMIAADDVVVSANGEPVQCMADMERVLASIASGDFLSLELLRRSPPPVQRCPDGHPLKLVGPRDDLPIGSRCHRCESELWHVLRLHRCATCDYSLCEDCFTSAFEKMNCGENANRGDPEWADAYEEDFGRTLSFSGFDKGTKIRIFWQTTGEWWLGEIAGYHPERGHEILYEEGRGENKMLSKQTIKDMSVCVYKVLKRKPVASGAAKAAPEPAPAPVAAPAAAPAPTQQQEDLLLGAEETQQEDLVAGAGETQQEDLLTGLDEATVAEAQPERSPEFLLTSEEKELLDGIEADLKD